MILYITPAPNGYWVLPDPPFAGKVEWFKTREQAERYAAAAFGMGDSQGTIMLDPTGELADGMGT